MLMTLVLVATIGWIIPVRAQVTNPQTGSIGLQGTIPTEPPTVGATISFPTNNQVFTDIPITVTGICPTDLLVKIFKNQVFAGAVPCQSNGTFNVDIDLFSGQNELIARVYDVLDQPGPDSNKVTVDYQNKPADSNIKQLLLTSNYALRGADPGAELYWPLAISGGVPPYAISIDWGDNNQTLKTLDLAGNFSVSHSYFEPGVYKMIVKATDSRDKTAFLQLVAVSNGSSGQDTSVTGASGGTGTTTVSKTNIIIAMWPIYLMFFFVISTFWIGRRYEARRIKLKVERHEEIRL